MDEMMKSILKDEGPNKKMTAEEHVDSVLSGIVFVNYMMNALAWYGVYVLMCVASDAMVNVLYGLVSVVVPVLLAYVIRRFTPGLIIVLIIHTAMFGLIALVYKLPLEYETIWVVFTALILGGVMVESIIRCVNGYIPLRYSSKWPFLILIFLMYVITFFKKDTAANTGTLVLLVVLLVFHMWGSYLQNLYDYMERTITTQGVPRDSITKLSRKHVTICTTIAAIFMMFTVMLGPTNLLGILIDKIKFILKVILDWFKGVTGFKLPGRHVSSPTPADLDMTDATSQDIPLSTENIIVLSVLAVISLAIIILFIYRQMHAEKHESLYGRMNASRRLATPDSEEVIKEEEKKGIKLFRNNREKVRHIFKKGVKKTYGKRVPFTKTAREFVDSMGEKYDRDSLNSLNKLYDVARYSELEISKDEVNSIKQIK
ncbi:MAG: hypothetical protein K6D02_06955 [Lachnospiraceae bacterium]|nr:hypothetical protein [Lachnospiraceae bacterium]